ncbi:MAG TPA: class II fructose-bisphosphatase [Pseudogracilibacillus sp.]|nr:class II fructose-bisphosphatase [Pseudogracilibacillus sp.]
MKSLYFDLLKITENAAIASFPWIGAGDEFAADSAATSAMRDTLNRMNLQGTVVIGEGEMDKAPMLFNGEKLGKATKPQLDIAVDPIDGTKAVASNYYNAISVIAFAPKGTLLHAPDMYMEKMIVGPDSKGKIDMEKPFLDNLKSIAKSKCKKLKDLNVYVQNRPRNKFYIEQIEKVGAKAHLFQDGDIVYSITTCMSNTDIDLFVGIGGAPEGVLSSVAIKSLGGDMKARLLPKTKQDLNRCMQMGINRPDEILYHERLINSENGVFIATGITDNNFMQGVKKNKENYSTHSILISGQEKKIRHILTE